MNSLTLNWFWKIKKKKKKFKEEQIWHEAKRKNTQEKKISTWSKTIKTPNRISHLSSIRRRKNNPKYNPFSVWETKVRCHCVKIYKLVGAIWGNELQQVVSAVTQPHQVTSPFRSRARQIWTLLPRSSAHSAGKRSSKSENTRSAAAARKKTQL